MPRVELQPAMPSLEHVSAEEQQFAQHLAEFHAGLPPAEQTLLTQLVALAAVALDADEDEVQGYLSHPYDIDFFAGLLAALGAAAPAVGDGATG